MVDNTKSHINVALEEIALKPQSYAILELDALIFCKSVDKDGK